jgi:peptide chain release factor 1
MFEKLKTIENKYEEVTRLLMEPEIFSKPSELQKYSKEQSDLLPLVGKIREYNKLLSDIEGAEDILKSGDGELRELAEAELHELREKKNGIEEELKLMLLPKDPRDEKNVIIEIRAGTGGDEAALFAAELLRMYMKYAEQRRWKVETIDLNSTGIGGIKEVIISILGKNGYLSQKPPAGFIHLQQQLLSCPKPRRLTSRLKKKI